MELPEAETEVAWIAVPPDRSPELGTSTVEPPPFQTEADEALPAVKEYAEAVLAHNNEAMTVNTNLTIILNLPASLTGWY